MEHTKELSDMHEYFSCNNMESYSDEKTVDFLIGYFEQEILAMVKNRIMELELEQVRRHEKMRINMAPKNCIHGVYSCMQCGWHQGFPYEDHIR